MFLFFLFLLSIMLTQFNLTSTTILELNVKLYFLYFICFHRNHASICICEIDNLNHKLGLKWKTKKYVQLATSPWLNIFFISCANSQLIEHLHPWIETKELFQKKVKEKEIIETEKEQCPKIEFSCLIVLKNMYYSLCI